jgi:hypothetical protein
MVIRKVKKLTPASRNQLIFSIFEPKSVARRPHLPLTTIFGVCSHMKRRWLPEYRRLYEAYDAQRGIATRRGIAWLFTFKTWLAKWRDSGHLHERGRKLGQYVMSRPGDHGPYSVENTRIVLTSENHAEKIGRVFTYKHHEYAPAPASTISAETRAKLSAAMMGKHLGKPLNAEHRAKISAGVKIANARKRARS